MATRILIQPRPFHHICCRGVAWAAVSRSKKPKTDHCKFTNMTTTHTTPCTITGQRSPVAKSRLPYTLHDHSHTASGRRARFGLLFTFSHTVTILILLPAHFYNNHSTAFHSKALPASSFYYSRSTAHPTTIWHLACQQMYKLRT